MTLKNLPYPDEVQETIGKFVPSNLATDYFKQRGILIAVSSREKLGEFGKLLFLDYHDYEELHDLATTGKSGQSISGFDVYVSNPQEEDVNVKDEVINWFEERQNDQIQVEELVETDENTLQGRLVYTRRVPGKYELVGKVESKVEFELKPTIDNKWHLTYFPEKITDQQQLKNIINEALGNKCTIDVPQLRGLPQNRRIEFFDRFLQYEFYQWTIFDVVGVKIKEPEQLTQEAEEEDELLDEMEQTTELEIRALGSIQEAILKGENLRTNPFVKEFEKDGYYFQSMTFRFNHNHKPLAIDLMINFKLRPIGLEISIEKSVESVNEKAEETSLSVTEESKVLEIFWETAKTILAELRRETGVN